MIQKNIRINSLKFSNTVSANISEKQNDFFSDSISK